MPHFLLPRRVELVEHDVDHDACDRDVEPDRQRNFGDASVFFKVARQCVPEGDWPTPRFSGMGHPRQVAFGKDAAKVASRTLNIVAFDGLESNYQFAGPRTDFERLGCEAVELLLSRQVNQVRMPTFWFEGSTLAEVPEDI